ncbi:MAG TPA: type I-E CRISPR-associated protein Cse1/CasA, partial [bacterium]|nr:type I-E CRISPR-associated protein Cse1/CasA [bacterium]
MYNLLNEKLFQVTANNREKFACSLPEVFAFLSTGETLSFSNLCFHQKQAWHAFLVQLGAISLHAAGEHKIPHTPAEWMELLRNLTRGFAQDEPWQLVVEDLSKPAFMQSPVPEGNLDGFGGPYYTPDENDILVTSKNHDVKIRRIRCPQPDHWIYSLVTLQTMQGYLGLGKGGRNYGISRMNGGYGSRPCVRYTSGLRWTDLFRRDLSILLEKRESLLSGYPFFQRQGGLALLWLEPWDGNESLSVECLDPFYIEVCRRLRLTVDEDRIVLFNRGSASNRVNAGELKGKTGDPWAPVDRAKDSVLTVGKNGFEYGLLQKLLFGNDY